VLIRIIMMCWIVLLVFLAGCVTTPRVESGGVEIETDDMRAVIVFSDSDRARILDHYRKTGKSKKMPPGLAKRDRLPPGLQRHIAKYGKLPPGLEGRRLAPELERALSRLPAGFVRLQVGGDIVLLNEKTRVVLDVIWDVMQQH